MFHYCPNPKFDILLPEECSFAFLCSLQQFILILSLHIVCRNQLHNEAN